MSDKIKIPLLLAIIAAATVFAITTGVLIEVLPSLISTILIAFVLCRNVLIGKVWYQKASTILALINSIGIFTLIIVQGYADSSVVTLLAVLFYVFLVRTSILVMNKWYVFLVRISLFVFLSLHAVLLVVPFQNGAVFLPSAGIKFMLIGSVFVLVIFAFLFDEFKQKENIEYLRKSHSTLNWFSTLVNLVSHNLRSPLATILGNAQILEAKYPSVFKSHELERITRSVQTSNQIIDRLLKASFVTDQLSNHTLKESLAIAYPQLVISGGIDELSYEQGVSIHLSLEVFLDNAFRFSPDQVELTMKGTRVEIRDYGPGLTQEQLNSFGRFKGNSLGTLHGIGIPFALRILESIGYGVRAENCNPGLLIVIDQEIEFKDAQLGPIFKPLSDKQIS